MKFKAGDVIEYKQLCGIGELQTWTTLTGTVRRVKNKRKSPFGQPASYQELTLTDSSVVSPYGFRDIKLVDQ